MDFSLLGGDLQAVVGVGFPSQPQDQKVFLPPVAVKAFGDGLCARLDVRVAQFGQRQRVAFAGQDCLDNGAARGLR